MIDRSNHLEASPGRIFALWLTMCIRRSPTWSFRWGENICLQHDSLFFSKWTLSFGASKIAYQFFDVVVFVCKGSKKMIPSISSIEFGWFGVKVRRSSWAVENMIRILKYLWSVPSRACWSGLLKFRVGPELQVFQCQCKLRVYVGAAR